MTPSQLAQDLINFLKKLPINSKISKGNWKIVDPLKNRTAKNGDIINSVVFDNKGKKYEFRIWVTDNYGKYIPKRWYISILNVTPGCEMDIHHIDLHNSKNHTNQDSKESIIHESGIRLKGTMSIDPITIINNTKPCWEEKAIEEILDHEIDRENLKRSL